MNEEKSQISLKDPNQDLKNITDKYSIKDKNILGKFKDFKKSATFTLNCMDTTCDFFEKTKNLIRWEDPRMT
jgi:hypothetical protein